MREHIASLTALGQRQRGPSLAARLAELPEAVDRRPHPRRERHVWRKVAQHPPSGMGDGESDLTSSAGSAPPQRWCAVTRSVDPLARHVHTNSTYDRDQRRHPLPAGDHEEKIDSATYAGSLRRSS